MMPNPADGYNERHIRKMKWRRIVTILSCIVVFCTAYALIIPAVTMSRDTACGKEEHTHTEACYDENGALICGREEHTHTDACLLAVRELTYEDGQLTICLRVESMDPLPEDLTLSVEEPQAAVQSAADGSGQTFTRRLTLLSQGQQVDTSSYAMTATVQVKPQALEPLEAALEQLRQEAPESDTGISLTLSQTTGRQEEQLAEELMLPGGEIPAVTADVRSGVISVQADPTANPHYTVQYYANIPRFSISGSNPLTVIDTSGGKLPQNRQKLTTKEIYLTQANGTTNKNNGEKTPLYRVAESKQLTRMYTDNQFEYIKSPNPSYINKLMDSPSYTLKQLWVLKEGKSSDSENQADWDVYSDPGSVHFTNRKDVTGGNVVYIQNGTVIRLVYDTNEKQQNFPANFYDYDISGGQDSAGRYLTGRNGINAASNYGTSRNGKRTWGSYCDVLAFGNDNCGTGMSRYRFDELFLNKYSTKWTDSNKETHTIGADQYGCTFGLADSLKDEKIVYNEWLVAPDLFNEGTANGKTIYTNDSSLTFSRVGDTYTLSAATVGGVGTINDLQYLFNPSPNGTTTYSSIFTNDFWPLDGAANGTDPLFGKDTPDFYGYDADAQGKDTSKTNVWKETAGRLPGSDDGNNHNCFFGMQYAVKFTLTADYVGPLEYYFFGDDDMWVFLDDKLVCDIGGVHSSVGEYVNLWDYLRKDGRTESETHTLTFFYTERGASGSTCYMNFTLPSVSGVNIEQKTSDLEVRKQVVGQDESGQEFNFDIQFYDQNGKPVLDDYAYTKYGKDGKEIDSNLVVHTGDKFTLKDGQYVRIRYLPFGLRYTITEVPRDGYTVSSTINGVTGQGSEAKGTILNTGQMNTVLFTNTMTYPNAITLQKQDLDGHILTGAAFRLVDSKGNIVNVVDNGSGSYTVPSTADDLIKDGELYYIASAADDAGKWVIEQNTTDSRFPAQLQKKETDNAYQQYRVYRQSDGSYSFYCEANQRWLDLDNAGLTNGTLVHFWTNEVHPTTHDNQKWYITVTETGLKIKPRVAVLKNSTAVLDLYASKLEQGGRIEVYEDNGTAAQRWKLVPVNPAAAVTTTDTLTVDANGRLTIQGLLPGTYTLKEVTAPDGYQTMADATIKVDANGHVTWVSGSPLVSAKDSQITVKNRPTDKTLTLTKQVEGLDTGKQKFGFTVTYVDAITGETKTEKWNLANGGSNTLQIPYGATVTISEPSHPGYSLSFQQGDMLVTNLDKNSYQFVITDDVTIIAVNTAGYELPDTGGPGAVWCTTGGLLLMAAAGGLLLYKNRNRRKGGRLLS
ncbi:MAG: fibro-slime domain-containing protein [Oscillibacter sp.]|nr:fibro-slime domain-containing protein [Oscillibacter sp.]